MVQRIAIYARVSTSDQSCERQIGELTSYAERSGFEIVGMFKETGSGTKNNRVERNKVIDLARHRNIDLVLVSKLSRWG